MKLAYTNWHKDTVHDDAIQSELTSITQGQLEFTNTPYVKAYRMQQDTRDNRGGGYGRQQRGKFQQRGGNNGGQRNDSRNDNRNNGRHNGKKRFK
jgi:hypothetical protein